MRVKVQFFSFFKDLAGAAAEEEELPAGSTIDDLLQRLFVRHPQLAAMSKSCLVAVGVEYETRERVLQADDEVSLFPPVQGG